MVGLSSGGLRGWLVLGVDWWLRVVCVCVV